MLLLLPGRAYMHLLSTEDSTEPNSSEGKGKEEAVIKQTCLMCSA